MTAQRTVHRSNRVDPWGDLHGVAARGLFTGNRGCLVDDGGRVVRHHRNRAWISCLTSFGAKRQPLDAPRVWTPIFFLDEAVALAAGHRPCGYCRRAAYGAYRDAVTEALDPGGRLLAPDLDRRLSRDRLHRGRGLSRRGDRRLWTADIGELPTGTVVLEPGGDEPHLVTDRGLHRFTFERWEPPVTAPGAALQVLTPEVSVLALRHGFEPVLHASSGVE